MTADDEGGPEEPTEEEDIGSGAQKQSSLGIDVVRSQGPGQGRIAIYGDQKCFAFSGSTTVIYYLLPLFFSKRCHI